MSLSIHDLDGRTISEVSTRAREVHLDQVHGTRTLTLEIDRFPLSEGTYELSAAVRDESGQRELDVRSRMLRFDVLKGKNTDGGLITLPARWVV